MLGMQNSHGQSNTYAIVAVDMVGYSVMARGLEDSIGSEAIALLHRKLTQALNDAMDIAGCVAGDVAFVTSTGDGEIRYFTSPTAAVKYAEAVHLAGKAAAEKWFFRVGIATGDVIFDQLTGPSGFAITTARRLEQAAKPGEVLIDIGTIDCIDKNTARTYGPKEALDAKHGAKYDVYRKAIIPSPKPSRTSSVEKVAGYICDNPVRAAVTAATIFTIGSVVINNSDLFGPEMSKEVAVNSMLDHLDHSFSIENAGELANLFSDSVVADTATGVIGFLKDILLG